MPNRPPALRFFRDHPKPKTADPFYLSPEWKALAAAAKKRDGYRCIRASCPTPERGKGGRLIANHKTPRRAGGVDRLDNLETLCPTCDARFHRDKGRAR